MKALPSLETHIRSTLDLFFARWPQPMPGKDRLEQCKLISHRGDYDNQSIFENTVAAFDRAAAAGVWGIELDLRWTQDLHPVVLHDTNLQRVFGRDYTIQQATLAELKSACPPVPTLADIIPKYGKKTHLMIEIKSEVYPDPARQNQILEELLAGLHPVKDYHFLTMDPQMFNIIDCVPRNAFLPVAHFNFFQLSKLALRQNYSGIAGHYLLLTRSRLKKHKAFMQNLATGYVNSKNCLFRELNRGVEWIFSDNAVELQRVVNQLLQTVQFQGS
ncbi:MAG: glycerophosphodiester phosphodiesterase family protein [Desulfobacterales bacterium]|jgi:glycerophosphoryl diester phosphodiesterase